MCCNMAGKSPTYSSKQRVRRLETIITKPQTPKIPKPYTDQCRVKTKPLQAQGKKGKMQAQQTMDSGLQ